MHMRGGGRFPAAIFAPADRIASTLACAAAAAGGGWNSPDARPCSMRRCWKFWNKWAAPWSGARPGRGGPFPGRLYGAGRSSPRCARSRHRRCAPCYPPPCSAPRPASTLFRRPRRLRWAERSKTVGPCSVGPLPEVHGATSLRPTCGAARHRWCGFVGTGKPCGRDSSYRPGLCRPGRSSGLFRGRIACREMQPLTPLGEKIPSKKQIYLAFGAKR